MTGSEKWILEIRGERRLFEWRARRRRLAIGQAMRRLAELLAAAFESFRAPFTLLLFVVVTLVGLTGILDRRVKLTLLGAGIRYARWGPRIVPWGEFSGYRLVTWRRNRYLQLVPRRPSELLDSFSWIGRLNNHCARLIGAPAFSIAVNPLEISEPELVDHAKRFFA